jgi:oxaloacetate decarboxylase gamma subunit
MEHSLVEESIKFMILGMGVVFVFLYLLVLLMQLQAYIISKYFPAKEVESKPKKEPLAIKYDLECEEENRRVAAIVGALIEHSKKRAK